MNLKEYFQLIGEGKGKEAEELRQSTIPNTLIKFVSLNGDPKKDDKKLTSTRDGCLWLSKISHMNDPFEFKNYVLDEKKLKEIGFLDEDINRLRPSSIFSEYGITALTENDYSFLPMWAYYANNHQGFALEFKVDKKMLFMK